MSFSRVLILFLALATLPACPSAQAQDLPSEGIPSALDTLAAWEVPDHRVTRLSTAEGDTAVVYNLNQTWWYAEVGASVHVGCGWTGAQSPFTLAQLGEDMRTLVLETVGGTDDSALHERVQVRYYCLSAFSSLRDDLNTVPPAP